MIIKVMSLGPVQTNCYWLVDEQARTALVVDPGLDPEPVLQDLAGYRITAILATHCHWDHIAGVQAVQAASGAPVWLPALEADWITDPTKNRSAFWPDLFPTPVAGPAPDRLLQEGDAIQFGGVDIQILHVPGHSPGSLAFRLGNVVLCGDALFQGGIGRTDLPGGDQAQLLDAIRQQLLTLPDDTVAAPGHGPATTVGHERRHNPFLTMA